MFPSFFDELKKIAGVLYHGSPNRLETLKPRQDHGDPRIPSAVFATPSRTFALAYAGKKWGNRDINQEMRGCPNAKMILREMRPGALQDTYGGQVGYLHHLPSESFHAVPGRRTTKEVISEKAVTPTKVEKVPNVLTALSSIPSVELVPYDIKSALMHSALRRQVSRMLEMKPADQVMYRKWWSEKVPPEMQELFEREHQRQVSKKKIAAYDPPNSVRVLESTYPHLLRDPVHRWRAEHGIELVHKEPTKQELNRVMANWHKMSPEQKALSDKRSSELFGETNVEHYRRLKKIAETVLSMSSTHAKE